ncbi:SAM-dependent methyltransferase [Actinomadura sp. DC4]|uniref:SAM-dependent methyltransferase n=1 Tax=Actinomadura sp. DC4 TaxID=3055069 RepID=UPI0025AED6F2|nr:SAM-dependent methyltransferase [Actinomadura sp. DC4]MDN3359687.1 SAM-dependent methyltransferase [Actinomadura sp. DC4]
MVGEIPPGVGWTALLTAYSRAQESREAGRLFEDPLAAAFVAAVHGAEAGGRPDLPRLGPAKDDGSSVFWNGFRFFLTHRTPFYDRRTLAAVRDGCAQVVFLGAGLDSRAFRLGMLEDITAFEVDQAPVHAFKQEVLDRHGAVPTCVRVPVVADITKGLSQPLLSAGFDPAVPTAWVAEGLLMYFSRDEADGLLDEITALSAPGSRIVGEYFSCRWENADIEYETLETQDRAAWDLLLRELRYGPVADRPGEWLSSHGWAQQEVTTLAEVGRRTGRPVPSEFARLGATRLWLFVGGLPAG